MNAKATAETADGSLGNLIELTTNYPENPTYDRRCDNIKEALYLRAGIVKVRSTSIVPNNVGVGIRGRKISSKRGRVNREMVNVMTNNKPIQQVPDPGA